MSGGHYNYAYSTINDLKEHLKEDIEKHSVDIKDKYSEDICKAYPKEVLDVMKKCFDILNQACRAAHDVEWFMEGDYGDDTFLECSKKWDTKEEFNPY